MQRRITGILCVWVSAIALGLPRAATTGFNRSRRSADSHDFPLPV